MILKMSEGEQAAQRPRSFLWFDFERKTGVIVAGVVWESGKPICGFPVFHAAPAGLWECGNLAVFARFPSVGGKSGKPGFGFPLFPRARHFHSPLCVAHWKRGANGDSSLHWRK